MSYATTNDLALRMGPTRYLDLTDDEGTGCPNPARAHEALDAAQAEIDSRLVHRYAAPVDTADGPQAEALLRALTLDLAEYRLHARRPPVPDAVREKASLAREWLHDVLVGRAHLPVQQPAAEPAAGGIVAGSSGPTRVFRHDDAKDSAADAAG